MAPPELAKLFEKAQPNTPKSPLLKIAPPFEQLQFRKSTSRRTKLPLLRIALPTDDWIATPEMDPVTPRFTTKAPAPGILNRRFEDPGPEMVKGA